MNMSDLKINLKNFLSGDLKAETEAMLETQGYVKKEAEPEIPEPVIETPTPEPEAVTPEPEPEIDAETVQREASESANKRAVEIIDLCALCGHADQASAFISSGVSVEAVRRQLTDKKAEDNAGTEIKNNISPVSGSDVNPLIADALKRAGK